MVWTGSSSAAVRLSGTVAARSVRGAMTTTEAESPTRARRSYDAVAAAYAQPPRDEPTGPMERSVLSYVAAVVPRGRPVLDVGCGSGRVTSHLRSFGLDVIGIDSSPSLVALARREDPAGRFEVGTPATWGGPDHSLGGVVSWYATEGLTAADLTAALATYRRLLEPGGVALVAFRTGAPQRRPEELADLLAAAGLPVTACLLREPEDGETSPHGYLVARARATRA